MRTVPASCTIQPHSPDGDGGRPCAADGDDADAPHAARVERFVDAVWLERREWQPQRLPHLLLGCERAPAVHGDNRECYALGEAGSILEQVSFEFVLPVTLKNAINLIRA